MGTDHHPAPTPADDEPTCADPDCPWTHDHPVAEHGDWARSQRATPGPGRSELTELLAAAAHDGWMASKQAQGIESRLAEWGEEFMVPYGQLSEQAKDIDRGAVVSVLDAIDTAGLSVRAGVSPQPETDQSDELAALYRMVGRLLSGDWIITEPTNVAYGQQWVPMHVAEDGREERDFEREPEALTPTEGYILGRLDEGVDDG